MRHSSIKRITKILVCVMFVGLMLCVGKVNAQNVYGRYVYSPSPYVIHVSPNNIGRLYTLDDSKVAVNFKYNNVSVVVHRVTEEEPESFAWFASCTDKLPGKHMFFDIYFIDESGNRVNMDMVSDINITLPEGFSAPHLYTLSTDGNLAETEMVTCGDIMSFKMESGGYYIVEGDEAQSSSETHDNTDNSENSDMTDNEPAEPPKTGTMSYIAIPILLSVLGSGLIIVNKKKQSRS